MGGTGFAANFNFAQIADTPGSGGGSGESAWNRFSWTDGGITVTATARSLDGLTNHFVYMDANNAGMGVCQILSHPGLVDVTTEGGSNNCSPASDDNLTMNEVLELSFSEKVTIDFTFVNGSHGTSFLENFGVAVDPLADPTMVGDFDQYLTTANMNPVLSGTTFYFIANATISGKEENKRQLYISTLEANPVPEPSTMLLFGSGLVGLIGYRWKRA